MKNIRKILIALAAALAVTAVLFTGVLNRVDKWVQDLLYQRGGVPSGEIVLIGIDEETLEELGPYGPSYRNVMAYALEMLASDPENLPAAVAIDVLYEGESGTSADEKLARAAEKLGCVVTASLAEYGDVITWENGHAVSRRSAVVKYVEPYKALRDVTVQGHINAMTDKDGILRHALLSVDTPDGKQVYSMAVRTALMYADSKKLELSLPSVDAGGNYYVPFAGKPGAYNDGYSVYRLIMGEIPSAAWAGKIVLIGPYATSLSDDYFTAANKGLKMFGVEYQANVIQTLLDGNLKRDVKDSVQLAAILILLAAAASVFILKRVGLGGIVCAGVLLLSFAASYLLYMAGLIVHVLWLPVGTLVLYLLALAYHYILASRERHRLALENERYAAELSLATRIQTSSLPKEFPPFPDRNEFDIYASMNPAKEVGGDLYDFFLIDDDHLAMVIGDVSGKGIPAALFMMVATALIHNAAINETSPAKVLTLVNRQICSRNPEEMFVTVWMGVLEISTGKLMATNAGHEYPALKQGSGSFELLKDKHSVAIGAMDGVRYREYQIQLEPGDKLFVYTDGIAEATDSNEQLFTTARMIDALRKADNGAPEEVIEAVRSEVDRFVGKAPQFDDMTMLCLRYHGPQVQND
ncbi:MAG: SpoIIE family protein phosphatase [Clostridiales bacterium]|nr:SpoIIE family protein phosphatase [Clostridiales bacterium]